MELIWIYCCFITITYGLEMVPDVTTVIKYNPNDPATSLNYTNELDQLIANYTPSLDDRYLIMRCPQGLPPPENSEGFCDVDPRYSGPCASWNGYNYNSSTGGPCIFLTSTNFDNWIPEYYNSETIPEDMPKYLKKHIVNIENEHGSNSNELKVVWVSCEGESSIDGENIGPIQYFPPFGFDGQYFPFKKEKPYWSPFVAVLFEKPKRGVPIRVHCKAWTRDREQSVYFKILINQ